MNNYHWLIVLFNSLFAWLIVHFTYQYLINFPLKKEKLIKKIVREEIQKQVDFRVILKHKLSEVDLSSEIGPFLDGHMEQIIKKIAIQIPMGEFLLTGALGQKIKSKVKEEVNQILPEIKEHLLQRLGEKLDIDKVIKEKIQDYDIVFLIDLIKKHTRKRMNQMKWLSALLGAILGLLELFLL